MKNEKIIIDDVEICWRELDTNVKKPRKTKREKEEDHIKNIYDKIDDIYVPTEEFRQMKKEITKDKVNLAIFDYVDKKCVKMCNKLINFVDKLNVKTIEQVYYEHDKKMTAKAKRWGDCNAIKYDIYEKMCK